VSKSRRPLTIEVTQWNVYTTIHPFEFGQIIASPGCLFNYRVIGPCCRLFDREQLPWPCCRLEWGGKEPSWRRIGRRFILDMATQDHPSYSVELLGQSHANQSLEITLYSVQLSSAEAEWWYAKQPKRSSDRTLPTSQPTLPFRGEGPH
jgi:hypothetical protein